MASRELINSLKSQGFSYAEIGRRLDRDSSLISQIARGKKKGVNLESGLEKLARGAKEVEKPQRRVTKSGEVAKVRKPKQVPKGALMKDKSGRIKRASAAKRPKTTIDRLKKIAASGGKVKLNVSFESVTAAKISGRKMVQLLPPYTRGASLDFFQHGGMKAADVLKGIEGFDGDLESYLEELAVELGMVDSAEGVESVSINAIY